jgi:hypothetical protein
LASGKRRQAKEIPGPKLAIDPVIERSSKPEYSPGFET